ncbi:FAS1 domain [Dillenia turbinata]|uniref:FAS1 domain n=1 Tax=Dillenia turbinata TaxID=194707 RepID=A0AAN8UBL6_9MAGN
MASNFAYASPFLIFLFLISYSHAMNITQLLSKYPDFSTLNNYLSQTQLNAEINRRQSITVLALDNSAISSLSGKSNDVLRKLLSLHVILDYYDVPKLQKLENGSALLTTLYQTSGLANFQQGFLNVSITKGTNDIAFGSAVQGSALTAKLVKSVAQQPYDISVLQIDGPITAAGIDGSASILTGSPPPKAPGQAPAPSMQAPPPEATAHAPGLSTQAPPPEAAAHASGLSTQAPPPEATAHAPGLSTQAPPPEAAAPAPGLSTQAPPPEAAARAPGLSTQAPPPEADAHGPGPLTQAPAPKAAAHAPGPSTQGLLGNGTAAALAPISDDGALTEGTAPSPSVADAPADAADSLVASPPQPEADAPAADAPVADAPLADAPASSSAASLGLVAFGVPFGIVSCLIVV